MASDVTVMKIVEGLRKTVIQEDTQTFQSLMEETQLDENVTNPYFRRALAFYQELNDQQREVLISIVRQAKVDAVVGILALIDDVADFEGQQEEFRLLYGDQEIQGDLSGALLYLEEKGDS